MGNTIKANKCKLNTVYFLTNMWWDDINAKYLINEPVTLKKSYTEKWVEKVGDGFSRRKQRKYYIFTLVNQPERTIEAYPFSELLTTPAKFK